MNKTNRGASTDVAHILVDIASNVLAMALTFLVFIFVYGKTVNLLQAFFFMCVFLAIFMFSAKDQKLYNITTFMYEDRILKCILKSFFTAAVLVSAFAFFYRSNTDEKIFFSIYFAISLVSFLFSNLIFIRKVMRKRKIINALFIGSEDDYGQFKYFLNKTNVSLNELGYVDYKKIEAMCSKDEDKGFLDNLFQDKAVDHVYVIQDKITGHEMDRIIDICLLRGIVVKVLHQPRRDDCHSYVSSIGTYPLITYHTVCLNNAEQFIKRVMDILMSIFGIIASSPIMLLAAIAIKLESKGPILFKQRRVGKNGRHFTMYKFRSMEIGADEKKKELESQNELSDNFMFKIKNDPRVTKVGKFIRKTSIDELPQFFNVLAGDMSMVGTRPPTFDEVERYDRGHWKRLSVKPGITGMWQVSGRSQIMAFDDVVSQDVRYIEHWSILLDIKILFKTVWVLLDRNGAY